MDDFTKRAKAGMGSVEKFVSNLPVIRDYQNKELRREADRKLRETTARHLEAARKRLIDTERTLLNKGKLTSLPVVDIAATRLQTLVDRIKTAPAGYAGFFSAEKIREPELEKIHKFDEGIAGSIPEINEKIDALNHAVEAGDDYAEILRSLLVDLQDLGDRMDMRKDAILAAGDDTPALPETSETTAPEEADAAESEAPEASASDETSSETTDSSH